MAVPQLPSLTSGAQPARWAAGQRGHLLGLVAELPLSIGSNRQQSAAVSARGALYDTSPHSSAGEALD